MYNELILFSFKNYNSFIGNNFVYKFKLIKIKYIEIFCSGMFFLFLF